MPDDDKQIDLERRDYHVKRGEWRPEIEYVDPRLLHPRTTRRVIASGIWAGLVIGINRFWLNFPNPWIVAAVAFAPMIAVFVWLIILDQDTHS